MPDDDDKSERITLPNGLSEKPSSATLPEIDSTEARLKAMTIECANWKEAYKDRSEPWKGWGLKPEAFGFERTWEQLRNDCLEARAERDKWRDKFMVLRSHMHGIRDSLLKIDHEIGRILGDE